jgi:hypothetical protein
MTSTFYRPKTPTFQCICINLNFILKNGRKNSLKKCGQTLEIGSGAEGERKMRPKIAVQNGDTFLVVGRLLRQQLFLRRSPVRNSCVFSSATKRTKQILLSFSGSAGASADETCRFNRFPFIRCLPWSNVHLKERNIWPKKCNLSSTHSTQEEKSREKQKRPRWKKSNVDRRQQFQSTRDNGKPAPCCSYLFIISETK